MKTLIPFYRAFQVLAVIGALLLCACSFRPNVSAIDFGRAVTKGVLAQVLYQHPGSTGQLSALLDHYTELLAQPDAFSGVDDIEKYLFNDACAKLGLAPGAKAALADVLVQVRNDYRTQTHDTARQEAQNVIDWIRGQI